MKDRTEIDVTHAQTRLVLMASDFRIGLRKIPNAMTPISKIYI